MRCVLLPVCTVATAVSLGNIAVQLLGVIKQLSFPIILGALASLGKQTVSFIMWNYLPPTGRFFMKFDI